MKRSTVINECLFLTGHAIWLETFPSMPSYIVPDSNGDYTPSVLAGFYMFFTMIILLQVHTRQAHLSDSNGHVSAKEYGDINAS